ncbi:response regulator [Halalkalibacter krulwichiae]|uniref:Circadian input-output histidine kinase CikA n=1 Tax=Halalkalibacter krulwichiae TaxID=199441 RepID=A0A1X9MF42_9BACI|nr:response regulator [Halalkalibacter krulwichiae]ARK31264.1 Autoinducer 2 sensor kinase/phosphatase LuxQ [Halalkalibacter krulwichiae]
MKIKTRLYVGFASVLMLMVILGGGALYVHLQQLHVNEVIKEKYEHVKLANFILAETNNTSRMLRDLLLGDISPEDPIIMDSRAQAYEAIDAYEQLSNSDEISELLTELRAINDIYTNAAETVIELVKNDEIEQATKVLIVDHRDDRVSLSYNSQLLASMEEEIMNEAIEESYTLYQRAYMMFWIVVIACFIGCLAITTWVVKTTTRGINRVSSVIAAVPRNPNEVLPRITDIPKDETKEIALAYNAMANVLDENMAHEKELKEKLHEENWIKTNIAEITTSYQGAQHLTKFAELIISKVTPMVGATYGVFYFIDEQDSVITQIATYAANENKINNDTIKMGEGLVGQCAKEKKIIDLESIPEGSLKVTSGLISASPRALMILPIEFEGRVIAVIELASFEDFTTLQKQLLVIVCNTIGVSINSIFGRMKIENLLDESQTLTEELQTQSEELQQQQEELQIINEKLEEQYYNSEEKTKELEKIKVDLEEKNRHVELSSKYKSEFLANMSHELRTPLNSMLILSEMLADNSEGNLTDDETEYAKTIFASGKDLLNLINDILDLSKIETGNIEIYPGEVYVDDLIATLKRQFTPVANQKGIDFSYEVAEGFPKSMITDDLRFKQVLKNLLSNAFKFTKAGSVFVKFDVYNDHSLHEHGAKSDMKLAISVTDTGIGIPKESQALIFEAFKQGDGTTTRMYGGTGLGLSISKEIVHLLGGYIEVESVVGKGSTFTVFLPFHYAKWQTNQVESEVAATVDHEIVERTSGYQLQEEASTYEDKSTTKEPLAGKSILLVDDDMRNVFSLTNALEKQKMKVVFAENGKEALEVLQTTPNVDLVLMDIMMPVMNGYEAMSEIRDIPEFETLPIIALTAKAMKSDREKCFASGASDYISKPVNMDQLLSLIRVWLHK